MPDLLVMCTLLPSPCLYLPEMFLKLLSTSLAPGRPWVQVQIYVMTPAAFPITLTLSPACSLLALFVVVCACKSLLAHCTYPQSNNNFLPT